ILLVDAVDQRALVIRLEEHDLDVQLDRTMADPGVDVLEGVATVDLGLARAEQVQVRAVEDEDAVAVAATHERPAPTADIAARPASTPSAAVRTNAPGTAASTT